MRFAITEGRTKDEANANAAFIVKAVNNHDRLIQALERIAAYDAPDAHAMIQQARAALAEVQKATP